MADQDATVYAEALIMTVARAFYEDDVISIIDVLIRDKYLRNDADMGTRLSLPPRQLRQTLQFLQNEHLVKREDVNDLAEGGSQQTGFWYIDYNHAVNVIRLRMYLLKKKLEEAESQARSSTMYLCPGYAKNQCHGKYTEVECQQCIDLETGFFLCPECVQAHAANPNPPPLEEYTLTPVDNSKALKLAMDNIRRVDVQLSGKMIGNQQLRGSIFELIKKVRIKGAGPLTSNLPSENRFMNIGSRRLAGTGRTAGEKLKKGKYLGGTTGSDDLTFLKTAMGQTITFEVEKGGGARANLLATRVRKRSKLLDEAAIRVGVELDLVSALAMWHQRKKEQEKNNDDMDEQKRQSQAATLHFLRNSIGRVEEDDEDERNVKRRRIDKEMSMNDDNDDANEMSVECEPQNDYITMTEDERRATFQAYYKKDMARQRALEQHQSNDDPISSLTTDKDEVAEYGNVLWEDG